MFSIFGVDQKTRIIGLTIQNGEDGIYTDSKLQILHNRIINNADGIDYESGGGICRDNYFSGNTDDGIDLDFAVDVVIENNIIQDNLDDGIEIRMHPYSGPELQVRIINNTILRNLEDGIQLVDYPDMSDRFIYIQGNVIADNALAGLGCMENANTTEDLVGAPIPERVVLLNNTFDGNSHGLTGGANLIAANNIFQNNTTLGVKNVSGNSIVTDSIFWNNGTDVQSSNTANATFANPLLSSQYSPSATSPALDLGRSKLTHDSELIFSYLTSQYLATAPDIGAKERSCLGLCDTDSPNVDEDGDGVSNCDEIVNNTAPCPTKPLSERLLPDSCVGVNGFLGHVNFLSLVNRQAVSLTVTLSLRNGAGELISQSNATVQPLAKTDININQLGLLPDSYGTVCVETNASIAGAWSGDVRQYGNLFVPESEDNQRYSYILRYPFKNPTKDGGFVLLNTNSLGNVEDSFVANWISLIDADPSDSQPVVGTIYYYDIEGHCLGSQSVSIPNGGRTDFSAHDVLGQNKIGTAVFEETRGSSGYLMDLTRYYIETANPNQQRINTAYVVDSTGNNESNLLPLSGITISDGSQLSVLEFANHKEVSLTTTVETFQPNGELLTVNSIFFDPLRSIHRIFTNGGSDSLTGSAIVQLPIYPRGLISSLLTYRIQPAERIYSVVSSPMQYSQGKQQIVDFNSYLNLKNELRIGNLGSNLANVSVRILNYDGTQISEISLTIEPKQTKSILVNDYLGAQTPTYGTIILSSNQDLIANNYHYITEGAAAFVVEGKSLLN